MDFTNKMIDWKNKGVEPSSDLIENGFQGGYKPPASIFNYQFGKTFDAISELQNAVTEIENRKASSTQLGGVKVGDGLSIDSDGVLSADAQEITVDSALSSTSTNPVQNKVINTALGEKVEKVNGKGLSTNDYTTAEKNKLAGIATGATKTTVDSTLSSSSTNPVQNKVVYEAISNRAASSHSHSVATTSASGFQSASDKAKLDGIETNANKYTHPTYTAKSSGLYKVTVDSTGHVSGATAVSKSDITALGIPSADTDTKNTAGSTNTSNKIYLIGATTQSSNPTTYSHDTVYVGTDGCLYSNGKKVITDVETSDNWDASTSTSSDNPISAERVTTIVLALEESLNSAIESGELTKLKVGTNLNTAEGSATVGSYNIVNSKYSMAVGSNNKTNGQYAMTVGGSNTISASYAFAAGGSNTVDGMYGVALGLSNTAHQNQTVIGLYADTASDGKGLVAVENTSGSVFVVGNGTSSAKSNVFRASAAGQCYGLKAFLSSGADFAEYFEWADGNPNDEDRRGRFVTLDGEKIRYANADDDYILGVVSTIGAFIGNTYSENWQGRYLTDVFGEWLTEQVDVPEETETYEVEKKDEETGETVTETVERVIPAHTETRYILNPNYDPEQEYISREFRKEWSPVGFHGQVVVIDDGTCQVNGYCKPSTDGIATTSENGYRVMSRIDDTHIKVLVR